MDEEKLILIVHGYPKLWDMSSGNYHDQQRKDALWEEIAQSNFEGKTA